LNCTFGALWAALLARFELRSWRTLGCALGALGAVLLTRFGRVFGTLCVSLQRVLGAFLARIGRGGRALRAPPATNSVAPTPPRRQMPSYA